MLCSNLESIAVYCDYEMYLLEVLSRSPSGSFLLYIYIVHPSQFHY